MRRKLVDGASAVKLHGEGAFNPGKGGMRSGGSPRWSDPPGLASRLESLTTGGHAGWRGNFPAYALNRWGGKVASRPVKALLLAGGGTERLVAWLDAIPGIEGITLVRESNADGEEGKAGRIAIREIGWPELSAEEEYHLIVADHAVSRLPHIEPCLEKLEHALAVGGVFALRDYTGPDRFQFSHAQMEVANALLPLLPPERRVDVSGETRKAQETPPLAWVINNDPLAAVNSREVRAGVAATFTILEEADLGGTVLMPLLAGIGHNFLDASEESIGLLDALWKTERALIDADLLPSDHWFAVAAKKPSSRIEGDREGVFISRDDVL